LTIKCLEGGGIQNPEFRMVKAFLTITKSPQRCGLFKYLSAGKTLIF